VRDLALSMTNPLRFYKTGGVTLELRDRLEKGLW